MHQQPKITIFDTTMRDGEMIPGVKLNVQQKLTLAQLLEEIQVDIIEVGYPGVFEKDFDEVYQVSKQIKEAIICGLSSTKPEEIVSVALAIKPAAKGRINVYTPINLKKRSEEKQTLEMIEANIKLARNYNADVEWSAFDATRSEPDFLCRAIETAIKCGATTVTIPDSLGMSSPQEFLELIALIINRVPNIEQATLSVHCHDDLGVAVENSLIALDYGVRQIECSINGLGARKGNANLEKIVSAIAQSRNYQINIKTALLSAASEFVTQITGIPKP